MKVKVSWVAQTVKNLPVMQDTCVRCWEDPWGREWLLPTPIFLPGEFQGMRRFVGYSPRGCKELDMTE